MSPGQFQNDSLQRKALDDKKKASPILAAMSYCLHSYVFKRKTTFQIQCVWKTPRISQAFQKVFHGLLCMFQSVWKIALFSFLSSFPWCRSQTNFCNVLFICLKLKTAIYICIQTLLWLTALWSKKKKIFCRRFRPRMIQQQPPNTIPHRFCSVQVNLRTFVVTCVPLVVLFATCDLLCCVFGHVFVFYTSWLSFCFFHTCHDQIQIHQKCFFYFGLNSYLMKRWDGRRLDGTLKIHSKQLWVGFKCLSWYGCGYKLWALLLMYLSWSIVYIKMDNNCGAY